MAFKIPRQKTNGIVAKHCISVPYPKLGQPENTE